MIPAPEPVAETASGAPLNLAGRKVWVAGHAGMVGAALMRRLRGEHCDLVTATRSALDLTRQSDVEGWMEATRPEVVFLVAGLVGGVAAVKNRPGDFLRDNLAIGTNVIHSAWKAGVRKLVFVASASVYPDGIANAIGEDALMSGPLNPDNEGYALSKLAGLKMCQAYRRQYGADFIAAIPANVYGPGDRYGDENETVAAALLRRTHQARLAGSPTLEVWGTGTPRREFLYVDDLADALVHLCRHYGGEAPVNVGLGDDITIRDLALTIKDVVGFDGEIVFLTDRPDGSARKLLDTRRLAALGWSPSTGLRDGLERAYRDFLSRDHG